MLRKFSIPFLSHERKLSVTLNESIWITNHRLYIWEKITVTHRINVERCNFFFVLNRLLKNDFHKKYPLCQGFNWTLLLPFYFHSCNCETVKLSVAVAICHVFLLAGRLRDRLRYDCTVHQNVHNVMDVFLISFNLESFKIKLNDLSNAV